jgi:hypothetical protein
MLKYYTLPSIKGEGWAHLVINTETGFFATASDWGNYVFIWTHPGKEFRAFLIELQPDYLYGKLMMGRPDHKVFDGKKTKADIIQAIEDYNNEQPGPAGEGWAYYEEELHLANAHSFEDEGDFEAWESETRLTDVWEYACYCQAPECTSFCERVWPRFVALLRAELEQEANDIAALEAVRPALKAEVAADIQRMTGAERNDR